MIKLQQEHVTILEALSQPIVLAQEQLNRAKVPFDIYINQLREQLGAEEDKFLFDPHRLAFIELNRDVVDKDKE